MAQPANMPESTLNARLGKAVTFAALFESGSSCSTITIALSCVTKVARPPRVTAI